MIAFKPAGRDGGHTLEADTIAGRSPSFKMFAEAITNGGLEPLAGQI